MRFYAIDPCEFVSCAEPGQVKIAWTLEAEDIAPNIARFAQETRAVATDAWARAAPPLLALGPVRRHRDPPVPAARRAA